MTLGKVSPLFSATDACDPALVELYLAAGADCNQPWMLPQLSEEDKRIKHRLPEPEVTTSYPLLQAASLVHGSIQAHERKQAPSRPTAFKENAEDIMTQLLAHGADYKAVINTAGQTILHYILMNNDKFLNEPLLALPGIDLNFHNGVGITPIMAAAAGTYGPEQVMIPPNTAAGTHAPEQDVTLRLLDLNVDAAKLDLQGKSILHHLIQPRGNPAMRSTCPISTLTTFLTYPSIAALATRPGNAGITPLHLAFSQLMWIRPGDGSENPEISGFPIIRLFASQPGADLLAPDSNLNTPLHYLARLARLSRESETFPEIPLWHECIRLGVDIEGRNKDGYTPLLMALKYAGYGRMPVYMIWRPPGTAPQNNNPFNNPDNVAKSPDPQNRPADDSDTGIWPAYSQMFEPYGADIHATNDLGQTALHIIAGRAIDSRSNPMRLPLAFENDINEGVVTLFKMFVEMGCDPWAEDNAQRTSLDVASEKGAQEILALFEKGERLVNLLRKSRNLIISGSQDE